MSQSIIAIKNPNEPVEVENPGYVVGGARLANLYGEKIKQGALVTIIDFEYDGEPDGDAELFIADRVGGTLYLQNNNTADDSDAINALGGVEFEGVVVTPEPEPEPVELETFTVFGRNDDGENFVAVVSATPETVREVGAAAAVVDEGYEHMVEIVLVAKGDQSTVEFVNPEV